MSREVRRPQRQRTVLTAVVVGLVTAVIGFLSGWYVSENVHQGTVTLDGQTYYSESVPLTLPPSGENSTLPTSFSFHFFTFSLWIADWYAPAGGRLLGVVGSPNGSTEPFFLSTTPSPQSVSGWLIYVEPGGMYGVEWNGSNGAVLLVQK